MNRSDAYLKLYFLDGEGPELDQTEFFHPAYGEKLVARRGRGKDPGDSRPFAWGPGTRAVSLLALRHKNRVIGSEEPFHAGVLCGGKGSLAASLDYAISKEPNWIVDMFGLSEPGRSIAKSVFVRVNPERKRPGPVIVRIDSDEVNPENVEIFRNGTRVVAPEELREMAEQIEKAAREPGDSTNLETSPKEVSTAQTAWQYHVSAHQLQREYLDCLENRVLDRKFAFVGRKASEAWLELCKEPSFRFYGDSLAILEGWKGRVTGYLPESVNYLAIRPGTGVKEAMMMDEISKFSRAGYFLLDTSEQILRTSIAQVEPRHTVKKVFVADYSQTYVLQSIIDSLRASESRHMYLSFLGNTLGTIPPGKSLELLRSVLEPGDLGHVEIYLRKGPTLEAERELETPSLSRYSSTPAQKQLLAGLADVGITSEDGIFENEYEPDSLFPETCRLDSYFRFTRNKQVTFLGTDLFFLKGERILLSYIYFHSLPTYLERLRGYGLKVLEYSDGSAQVADILCAC